MIQSIYQFIVEPKGGRYNNTEKAGDKEFYINTVVDEKDYRFVNRIGIIKSLPLFPTELEEGMEVIVHHNVFRRYWGQQGDMRNSDEFLQNDMYLCDMSSLFLYRKPGEEWNTFLDSCFVRPISKEKELLDSLDKDEELKGTLFYSNKTLEKGGLKVGDTVGFTPYSEYEFNIDGERLFRMRDREITCKFV